jgi:uncharacterized protein YqjF (DUF2071 family)
MDESYQLLPSFEFLVSIIAQTSALPPAILWLLNKWRSAMTRDTAKDWQILAEQASVEMDGAKLSALVEQLCAMLDKAGMNRAPNPL